MENVVSCIETTAFIAEAVSDTLAAIDTARATVFLLDAHATIQTLTESSSNVFTTMYSRQKYFADRTIGLLDIAYEFVGKAKVENRDVAAKIDLLKSKITELKQLASQLRVIAYKQELTRSDIDKAFAILNSMEKYRDEISKLGLEILEDMMSQP